MQQNGRVCQTSGRDLCKCLLNAIYLDNVCSNICLGITFFYINSRFDHALFAHLLKNSSISSAVPSGTLIVTDTAHMVEALSIRMKNAGLQVDVQEAMYGQKVVVGRKA